MCLSCWWCWTSCRSRCWWSLSCWCLGQLLLDRGDSGSFSSRCGRRGTLGWSPRSRALLFAFVLAYPHRKARRTRSNRTSCSTCTPCAPWPACSSRNRRRYTPSPCGTTLRGGPRRSCSRSRSPRWRTRVCPPTCRCSLSSLWVPGFSASPPRGRRSRRCRHCRGPASGTSCPRSCCRGCSTTRSWRWRSLPSLPRPSPPGIGSPSS
mmetsp:Transcript_29026/g.81904  ORF Transcript_29026/g.81904 Transcript_29026/m.81904 type:complete len:207 (-) Transcript_29026:179-799(-)